MSSAEIASRPAAPGLDRPAAPLSLARRLNQRGRQNTAVDEIRGRAGAGDAAAMTELGARLLIGKDAPLAPEDGLAQIRAGAERGDADALTLLATLAGAGFLMPQSWSDSLDHLLEAARRGSHDARGQLRLLAGEAAFDGGGAEAPGAWRELRDAVDVQAWTTPPPRRPVWEAPRIRMADGFASAAVCDWLADRARGGLRPAMMYNGASKTEEVDPHRTCSDYQFDVLNTDLVLLLVRERIAALTKLPTVAMEPPRIFHYAVGEQIKAHYDRCGDGVEGYGREGGYLGDRIVTFLLYLNDGFEGGDLEFPKVDFRCKGAKGDAVYFAHVDPSGKPDPLSLHAGLVIRSGEKWVLSQWIHDRPFGVATRPPG